MIKDLIVRFIDRFLVIRLFVTHTRVALKLKVNLLASIQIIMVLIWTCNVSTLDLFDDLSKIPSAFTGLDESFSLT